MSDLIKELRELAASEEVADRAADELERIIALDSESKLEDRDETIKILEREVAQQGFYNEELRKQCDTLEFRAGDALDRAVRAEQENEELRNAIDQEMVIAHLGVFNRGDDPVKAIKELMLWSQGVGEYFAKEELAALKAQSTEPVAWRITYLLSTNPYGMIPVLTPHCPEEVRPGTLVEALITQDQAAALVEDFKRKIVWMLDTITADVRFQSKDCYRMADQLRHDIESLPLEEK